MDNTSTTDDMPNKDVCKKDQQEPEQDAEQTAKQEGQQAASEEPPESDKANIIKSISMKERVETLEARFNKLRKPVDCLVNISIVLLMVAAGMICFLVGQIIYLMHLPQPPIWLIAEKTESGWVLPNNEKVTGDTVTVMSFNVLSIPIHIEAQLCENVHDIPDGDLIIHNVEELHVISSFPEVITYVDKFQFTHILEIAGILAVLAIVLFGIAIYLYNMKEKPCFQQIQEEITGWGLKPNEIEKMKLSETTQVWLNKVLQGEVT